VRHTCDWRRKGYTEVFTDSDGDRHGPELGKAADAKSDANKVRYAGRQTLAAIAISTSSKAITKVRTDRAAQSRPSEDRVPEGAVIALRFAPRCLPPPTRWSIRPRCWWSKIYPAPIVGYDRGKQQNRRLAGWPKA